MRLRAVFVALLASAAMVIAAGASASANVAWCTSDPPTHVNTVAGANVTVNTSVTVPKSEGKLLNDVTADATATADAGGTLIAVNVHLPAGISTATVVSSSNKYRVSATASGAGGTTVTLYLLVPVD